jgi:hypothetical protein
VISDHWAAADWRGGEPVRVGSEAWSIPDVLRGVGYLGNIVTSFPSILRFFRIPGVVTVPLIDMPDTTMAVAVRADIPNSALADDLTAAARLVAAELAYLIPGARALETTTPDAPGAAVRA